MPLKEQHAKTVRYKAKSIESKPNPVWRAFLIWYNWG